MAPNSARYSTQADAVKMLVANKVDKTSEDGRVVTREEGEESAWHEFQAVKDGANASTAHVDQIT